MNARTSVILSNDTKAGDAVVVIFVIVLDCICFSYKQNYYWPRSLYLPGREMPEMCEVTAI